MQETFSELLLYAVPCDKHGGYQGKEDRVPALELFSV